MKGDSKEALLEASAGVRKLPFAAGLFVMGIGGVVLVGWALGIETLKSILPAWVSMKANTALGMVLSGASLMLLAFPRRSTDIIARILAGVLAIVGILTLLEYFSAIDFRIDNLLFEDSAVQQFPSIAGRMSPSTAFAFLLVSAAVFVRTFPRRLHPAVMVTLATTMLVVAGFAMAGYLVDSLLSARMWNYTGMAAHTSLGFLVIGVGFLGLPGILKSGSWALGPGITAGFAVGVAVMLLSVTGAYKAVSQLNNTLRWVAHRHEIRLEIERAADGANEISSATREYLLSGNEAVIADRESAVVNLRSSLSDLNRLTLDNSRQQQTLNALEPLVTEQLAAERAAIDLRRQSGRPAGDVLANFRTQARVHEMFDSMAEEEGRLLLADDERARQASITAYLLVPVGVFISLTMLTGALFFMNHGAHQRIAAEKSLGTSLRDVRDLQAALDEHAIVAITDPQGRITYANDKFCSISKYSHEELIGQDHRIVNSGYHSKEFIRDLWTTIGHGRVWKGEIRNRAKDGSIYWVDTTIVPFLGDDGKPRQYVAIRADISSLKQIEQDIRDLNATLERRVERRTAELASANKELDTFCYSVSHDLRTPLRAISGFTKVLSESYASTFDERGRDYMQRVMKATERMGELIDDLLKLSRVTREELHPEDVDLSAVAKSVVAALQQSEPGRTVDVRLEENLHARGDSRLLRVLLENLLGNAWKFTARNPQASIDFGRENGDGEQPSFHVRDNGAGFDMRYADKLFGAFQRLHRQQEFPGTGIGLATVQRIVHRHGGRVWAEAEVDKGATFFFSI